uniref:Acetyltransferase (GNAT) family protein n=1 Tax=Marseillevirus LCMAC103 TaxID=2506604 RepID=A0A481YUJ3_9VIRU|nr:MAG: acetyltransferase (GNAT) family protein [Marseillevirus LCMAC103]
MHPIPRKYIDVLPAGYSLSRRSHGPEVTFFIAETGWDGKPDVTPRAPKGVWPHGPTTSVAGAATTVVDAADRTATLTFVETNPLLRGNGIATHLLLVVAAHAHGEGAETIELDDDSDRAWRPDNVYTAVGLAYTNPKPEPEMSGKVATVLAAWPRFVARRCAQPAGFYGRSKAQK